MDLANSNSSAFPRRNGAGSPFRPWLLPLVPLYRAGAGLHRLAMRAEARIWAGRSSPEIPMVVVGALRAGGSGKTSVTAALAEAALGQGLRPAILAYRLGGSGRPASGPAGLSLGPDCIAVEEDSDWRETSDEALLLRRITGAPVFVTRHRRRAWQALHRAGAAHGGPFDLVIADDGYQDPRLRGAYRILLRSPGESPVWRDLLPAGPFRETRRAAARADLILEGPIPAADSPEASDAVAAAGTRGESARGSFHRRLRFPTGFEAGAPWIAVCGLGDNRGFLEDLAREGVRPVETLEAGDHRLPAPARLRACLARHPRAGLLLTGKDAVKLTPALTGSRRVAVIGARVDLHPPAADLLAAILHLRATALTDARGVARP